MTSYDTMQQQAGARVTATILRDEKDGYIRRITTHYDCIEDCIARAEYELGNMRLYNPDAAVQVYIPATDETIEITI